MVNGDMEQNAKKGKRLITLFNLMYYINFLVKCFSGAMIITIPYLLLLSINVPNWLIVLFVFSITYIISYKIYFSSVKVLWFIYNEKSNYVGIYHKNRSRKCWELVSFNQLAGFFIRSEVMHIPSDFDVIRDIDCTINEALKPQITITFEVKDKKQFIKNLVNRDFHEISDLIEKIESDLEGQVDVFLQFFTYEIFTTIEDFEHQLRALLVEHKDDLDSPDFSVTKIEVDYDCNLQTVIVQADLSPQ